MELVIVKLWAPTLTNMVLSLTWLTWLVTAKPSLGQLSHKLHFCFLNLKDSLSINVAHNNQYLFFEIANNSMVEYPAYIIKGEHSYNPYDFEILEIFFKSYVIAVNWIDCNYTWGWYDDETGRWTGAVGKVKMNTFLIT